MTFTYARHRDALLGAPVLRTVRDDRGQGLGEYGLILGFVAVLCVAAVMFLKDNIVGMLSNIGSTL
jgi:Flp pilus assembly pilin Flp